MDQHQKQGFTLVELIVVVTILAILATIGFVSYSSYLTGVRDTNRIAQLTSISDGLNLYSTKNDLPIPDNNLEVSLSGSLIAYQGTAGANTLETIDFSKGGKDPKDDTYFSYYLTKNRKYFQLMAFLEESENLTSGIINSTHAIDYIDRIPTVSGKKLGIMTDDQNMPIEQGGENVDIGTTTSNFKAFFDSKNFLEGDNSILYKINQTGSCKRIKELKGTSQSGIYTINPAGVAGFKVYCDMTTDGGGWTFVLHVDGSTNSTGGNFFESAVGTYQSDRSDTGTHYSIDASVLAHTEMMFSFDVPDSGSSESISPTAENPNKLLFYKYSEGDASFYSGPVPCGGTLTGYQYKIKASANYEDTGSNNNCNSTYWWSHPSGAGGGLWITAFSTTQNGVYWGEVIAGIGGEEWGHDAWVYVR